METPLLSLQHERGLAHFAEHIGFATTKRFGPGELARHLERLGVGFGHDLNASTSLDDTTYRIDLPLGGKDVPTAPTTTTTMTAPSDNADAARLGDAIGVLAEWALHVSATDADVERERRVIEAEWRSKRGPAQRMVARYWCVVRRAEHTLRKSRTAIS